MCCLDAMRIFYCDVKLYTDSDKCSIANDMSSVLVRVTLQTVLYELILSWEELLFSIAGSGIAEALLY